MSSCAKESCVHSNVCMYFADRCIMNGYGDDFKAPQPKRPHGEWIPINIHAETWDYKCSVCGAEVSIDFPNCPYCLADMQKKEVNKNGY